MLAPLLLTNPYRSSGEFPFLPASLLREREEHVMDACKCKVSAALLLAAVLLLAAPVSASAAAASSYQAASE
jgi:hypothetical protein